MNWYLRHKASARTMALHLLDEDTALGRNPLFSCPLPIPEEVIQELILLHLAYFSFDGEVHIGQLVINRALAKPMRRIFAELLRRRFPIASMVPIVAFDWDDERSMRANNTSGFNYRYKDKPGPKELSVHALGLALDLNPWCNPCVREGVVTPKGAHYNQDVPGTIGEGSWVVDLFLAEGARWGGHWATLKDYQHFEFPCV